MLPASERAGAAVWSLGAKDPARQPRHGPGTEASRRIARIAALGTSGIGFRANQTY